MKKKTIILIVSVLVLAILIGGGVWQWKKAKNTEVVEQNTQEEQIKKTVEQEQASQTNQTVVDTSDWKIYRDKKYGFEIKYNPSWEIIQNPGKWALGEERMYISVNKSRNDIGMNIGRIKSDENPKKWFEKKQLGSGSVVFDKEYQINNYETYYAKIDMPSAHLMHEYLISNKKSLILLSFQEKYRKKDVNTGEIKETSFSEYLPEFEAMVNSIRFID